MLLPLLRLLRRGVQHCVVVVVVALFLRSFASFNFLFFLATRLLLSLGGLQLCNALYILGSCFRRRCLGIHHVARFNEVYLREHLPDVVVALAVELLLIGTVAEGWNVVVAFVQRIQSVLSFDDLTCIKRQNFKLVLYPP